MPSINSSHIDGREASQEEFLRLLLPLRDRLAHYARAVSRRREEADDLVSDTILAALEGFERLHNREAFASYVFRIASRLQKRRRWRRKLFGEYDDDHARTIGSSDPSPETAAEVVMLHAALEKLPAAQREAIVLFELGGLSLEEIRQIQGGTISAIKSRLSRGRQELARLLGAREPSVRPARSSDKPLNGSPREATPAIDAHIIYSGRQING